MSDLSSLEVPCLVSAECGIALVGGSGFVGRAVRAILGEPFVEAPITALTSEFVILHLAARADPSWPSYASNIAIDAAVAMHCETRGAAGLVYASGNNVYPLGLDCRVGDRTEPLDLYGVAKVAGEQVFRTHLSDLPVACLRIADVFGVGQRYGNLVKALENAVSEGLPIRRFGNGGKLRSMILVNELARVILHSAQLARDRAISHETWNVCHEGAWTVSEIIDYISNRQGIPIEQVPVDVDVSDQDRRTMVQSSIPGYSYEYSLQSAIDAWLDRIIANRTGSRA